MNKFIKLHSINKATNAPMSVILHIEEIRFVEHNNIEKSTGIAVQNVAGMDVLFVTESVDTIYKLLEEKGC